MSASDAAAGVNIDWSELGEVIGFSLVVSVGLVALFAVGVRMLSFRTATDGPHAQTKTGIAVASVLFLVCAVIGGYGIYLLIEK